MIITFNKGNCKQFFYTEVVIGADSTHNYRLPWCSLVVHFARGGQRAWISNGSFRSNSASRDVANTLWLRYHNEDIISTILEIGVGAVNVKNMKQRLYLTVEPRTPLTNLSVWCHLSISYSRQSELSKKFHWIIVAVHETLWPTDYTAERVFVPLLTNMSNWLS